MHSHLELLPDASESLSLEFLVFSFDSVQFFTNVTLEDTKLLKELISISCKLLVFSLELVLFEPTRLHFSLEDMVFLSEGLAFLSLLDEFLFKLKSLGLQLLEDF